MFHSLFTVSIFDINLLMFDMTLRRLKFPANVRVHIHKSEKLILCISILLLETVSYATTLVPNGLVTALTANGYAVPGGVFLPLS